MVKRTDNNISGKLNNSNNLREESQTQEPCDPWIWVPKVYKTCAIAYQGDEPDHECEEWNQIESPTEGTWEYNPACEDTGEFDEEDLCSLFGIGCPDDEDDDPCEMYGICGNEDNCEAMCETIAASLSNNSNPISEELSVETIDIGNFRKRKDITWTCHRGTGWILTSKEEGIVELYDVTNNKWKWISLEHKSIAKTGVNWGGTVEVVNDSGTPSITPQTGQSFFLYASMKIDYSIKYSPVCDCPIVSQIVPPYTLYYQNNSPHYEAKP